MGSISLRGLKRLDKNMALLLVTLAALVACSTANMHSMQNNMMMQGMMPQQQGMMMVQAGNGGCSESESSEEGGCEIPMGNTIENVEEYLDQQMQQQQYATQQMAEKVKAQFQAMVQDAMMKKYRYVMSLVTEYISFCQCADVSTQTYNAVFVESARRLNMTDYIQVWDANRLPYQAKNEEDARALVFGNLVKTICTSGGQFLEAAARVTARVEQIRQAQGKK